MYLLMSQPTAWAGIFLYSDRFFEVVCRPLRYPHFRVFIFFGFIYSAPLQDFCFFLVLFLFHPGLSLVERYLCSCN